MGKIYLITNKINNKIYIGQTTSDRDRYYGGGKILKQAIKKYGKHNFIKDILEEGNFTQDELDEKEIFYIKAHKSQDHKIGYNILPGGFGGRNIIITEETRKKMSIAHKGKKKKPFSTEHKKKLSEAKRGIERPNRRKPVLVYNLEGVYLFEACSTGEAGKLTNNYDSNISACCKGKKKSVKGYIFKYKSN